MRNYQVIKSIFSEAWFISPDMLPQMQFYLSGLFNPNLHFEPKGAEDLAKAFHSAHITRGDSSVAEKIGIVEIVGAMNKYETLCSYGMENYREFLRRHDQDPDVRAVVLVVDSPGSTVAGIQELSEEIQKMSKPVVAYISDHALSGGYWTVSSCREVIANSTTAMVGSIGVMMSFHNLEEYYKKQGISILDIYAPQSSDKNQEYRALLKGNEELTKDRLKVFADKFHAVVRANRPGIGDEHLTGKVYFAGDVVGSLVDHIGPLEFALQRAAELADQQQEAAVGEPDPEHQSNNDMSKIKDSALATLAAAAGVTSFESADGTLTLNSEQVEAIADRLTAQEDADDPDEDTTPPADPAPEETPAPDASGSNADVDVAALIAERDALKTENARLKQEPGAEHSSVGKETDSLSHGNDTDGFAANFAAGLDFLKSING